jgi:hypothetical protein
MSNRALFTQFVVSSLGGIALGLWLHWMISGGTWVCW